MKATSKQEFFDLLKYELNRIGIEDTADIFADFEEHFSDSAMQGIPEDKTAEQLGDIKEIARGYLNLESSRINSIIARDNERKKVSLTKPGQSVPADLSLLNSARDIANSDNIREYTPKHFSEEIYPNFAKVTNGGNSQSSQNTQNSQKSQNTQNAQNAQGNPTVAEAFSQAGKAALDAAKVTGHALADAFGKNGVKEAVIGAGKSAADAVKNAGREAVNHVKGQNARKADGVPHPKDDFRANHSASRKGEIPPQNGNAKTGKFKFVDVTGQKMNINGGKLAGALLLDVFVWSWLLPVIFSLSVAIPGDLAISCCGEAFYTLFQSSYNFFSRIFLTIALLALAVILLCFLIKLVTLGLRLVRFVVNQHIRALYDL